MNSIAVDVVSRKSPQEVLAMVKFPGKYTVEDKVDTGAMVSCMPLSILPKTGLSKEDLQASKVTLHGVSGTSLQNCGTIEVEVMCNRQKYKAKFYMTKLGSELILGLGFCKKFKLVNIASTCIQWKVSADVEAVHTMQEADYTQLQKK